MLWTRNVHSLVRKETGEWSHEIEAGDMRQETRDRRYKTGDVRQTK